MLAGPSRSGTPSPKPVGPKRVRRAATALEYLFCATLVLVVCIAGVQSVGSMLKRNLTDSAHKLQKSNPVK